MSEERTDIVFKVAQNNEPEETQKEIQEFIARASKGLANAPKVRPGEPLMGAARYYMFDHNFNHKTKLDIQQEGPNEFLIRIISEEEFKNLEREMVKKVREDITLIKIRGSIERFITKLEQ